MTLNLNTTSSPDGVLVFVMPFLERVSFIRMIDSLKKLRLQHTLGESSHLSRQSS